MISRFCLSVFLLVGLLGASIAQPVKGQTTFRIMQDRFLPGVDYGNVGWGDFDLDGDFDLVITGRTAQGDNLIPFTGYYRYERDLEIPQERGSILYVSEFTELETERLDHFTSVWQSAVACGDYDGDGDLDLVVAGLASDGSPITHIYENTDVGSGSFERHATLTGVRTGDAAWGDYDNDGDLDLVVAGIEGSGQHSTVLYENQAGLFMQREAGMIGVGYASVEWGDYDADGDQDILLAGVDASQTFVLKVYRNEGMGTFVDAGLNVDGLAFPSVDWGDYDNDGDLDIVLNGGKLSPFGLEGAARRYRNEGGSFVRVSNDLKGGYAGGTGWGDFDGDGRLDFLAFGGFRPNALVLGNVYWNAGGDAVIDSVITTGGLLGAANWGDYDGDGDLDFTLLGQRSGGARDVIVHRNDLRSSNPRPGTPTGLQAILEQGGIVLAWEAPPGEGLSYNLRVGTTPGASDVVAPMALPTGRRLLSARGNAGHRLEWTLQLPPGRYYWTVQALNTAYAGSAFAPEQSFTTGDPDDTTPPAMPAGFMARSEDSQVVLEWEPNTEPDLARYLIYRGTTPEPETVLASVLAGTDSYVDTDVQNGTVYYYRLRAQDEAGNLSAFTDTELAMPNLRFTEVGSIGLPATIEAGFAWGDYDGDGDPDIKFAASVFQNEDNNLLQVQMLGSTVTFSPAGWGDYDGDGDLDLAFIRSSSQFGSGQAVIYRNDEGTFVDIQATLLALNEGDIIWADYDSDGDLDLLLAGENFNTPSVLALYRNDDGMFVDSGLVFEGGTSGAAAWGDYDADGDPDLVITNFSDAPDIYRNDGGTFVGVADVGAGRAFKTIWGDYDADGDLDLAVADRNGTRIYRNDNGSFVDTQTSLPILSVNTSSANVDMAWADYDNDGDLDLLLAGNGFTELYRNTGNGFTLEEDIFANFGQVAIGWADYDSDGDLDLLMSGRLITNIGSKTVLYRNNTVF